MRGQSALIKTDTFMNLVLHYGTKMHLNQIAYDNWNIIQYPMSKVIQKHIIGRTKCFVYSLYVMTVFHLYEIR